MAEEEEQLSESITFRVAPSDLDRLREVAGPVPRSLVARAAMRIGLEAFEADPSRVLDIKPAPRGPKPRRSTKPKGK